MKRKVLIDAGPLVAYLDRSDEFHNWVMGELARIEPPLLTCERVWSCICCRGSPQTPPLRYKAEPRNE